MDYVIADLWQLQQYQVAFKQDRQLIYRQSVTVIDQLSGNGNTELLVLKMV